MPDFTKERAFMVEHHIASRGVRSALVLKAMGTVPREEFLPAHLRDSAYEDTPLPIGEGQPISQPYIVAFMVEALGLEGGEKVLEIGAGSGYAAAILSRIAGAVYTVERIDELLRNARRRFRKLGLGNIRSRHDDGRLGWPDEAPFDAIMVTAAGADLENALLDQLASGGVLVAPVGPPGRQALLRVRATEQGWQRETLAAVSFVPLLGGIA